MSGVSTESALMTPDDDDDERRRASKGDDERQRRRRRRQWRRHTTSLSGAGCRPLARAVVIGGGGRLDRDASRSVARSSARPSARLCDVALRRHHLSSTPARARRLCLFVLVARRRRRRRTSSADAPRRRRVFVVPLGRSRPRAPSLSAPERDNTRRRGFWGASSTSTVSIVGGDAMTKTLRDAMRGFDFTPLEIPRPQCKGES